MRGRGELHIADIVSVLEEDNLLPAIIFRTARSQCDADVENSARSKRLLLSTEQSRILEDAVRAVTQRYDFDVELIKTHPHYSALLKTGTGAHHAGQLLMWRLLLEELMAAGLLRVLVATGTVAAGVDFPARTVVITAHSKRGADGFNSLTSAEFQQMSGRAGRRGRDTVGFCVAAPAPFCDARALLKIAQRPPEPLVSSYFPAPSTVLNLLRYRNVDDLRHTVEQSLAAFMDRRASEHLLVEAEDNLDRLPQEIQAELAASDAAGNAEVEEGEEDKQGHGVQKTKEQKKIAKRVRRLRKQALDLRSRQRHLLESALVGLSTLGYVDGLNLSPKGFWAANLCTSIVLELAEILESGMMEKCSAERLAAIVASISGDEHRKYLDSKTPPLSKDDINRLSELVDRVGKTGMPGIASERLVSPSAAYTVLVWMHAETWQEFRGLLLLSGVAEGDAARLITQTAEHLNQLTRLSETHREVAFRAEEAKRRILRPPLTEVMNLDIL